MSDIAQLGLEVRSDGVVTASRRLKDLDQQAKKSETASERLERQFKSLDQTAGRLGRSLSMTVTAPMLGVAAASVKMATTFDSELTRINTLVGVSRDQIAEYRKEILTLAPALGQQPAQMASALFAVTSAGQRGAAAMRTLEAAAKASALGRGAPRSIARAATAAVTSYGEANLSSSDAVEILVGTVEQGNLEASELAGVLGRVIGIAAEAGVTFQDAGAFIASFTRQGVDAAQAVTGLRGVLATLVREPTAQAIEAFEKMGTSAEEFKRSVREEGFITAFQELVNEAERTGVSLGGIVPEVEALSGALAVFASEGSNAAQIAEDVGAAVGTLDERLQAAMESDPALAFAQFRAELSTLLIELSTNILPATLELVGILRDMSESFRELNPETQKAIVYAGGLAAALGPVLIALSVMASSLRTIIPLLLAASRAMGPLGILISVLGTLAVTTKVIPDLMRRSSDGVRELGDESETAAERVARLTGNLDGLRKIQIRTEFEAITADAIELRNEIERLESIPKWIEDGGSVFANPAFIEAQENAADLRVEYESLVQMLDQLKTAYETVDDVVDTGSGATTKAAQTSAEWAAKLAALRAELAGPLAVATNNYAANIRTVLAALAAGEVSIDDAREAIRLYRQELENFKFDEMAKANDEAFDSLLDMVDQLDDWDTEDLETARDRLQEISEMEWDFENLAASFHPVSMAVLDLQDQIAAIDANKVMTEGQKSMTKFGATANFAFDAIKSGIDSSSKAYKRLQQAQQLMNIALGIAAIMEQGKGDPYTAFARMAAMASMVASFGLSVRGGGGGSGGLSAADRQASQGSGSVLGDASAQSETIINALETQVDTLERLIGINSSMRDSIQALADTIGQSALFIARNFDPMRDTPTGVSRLIDRTIPGKRELDDLGLDLIGGLITDMIEETLVSGFVQRKHRIDTGLAAGGIGDQFSAILADMVNTVTEAATMLGVPLSDIEARIASFRIESQKISLMDLSATEQQEQLNAVFGRIFDDLAGAVVPFAADFQQVGEGIGETLIRMVTSMQITEEAIFRLGLSIGELEPEEMARVSVGLIEAAGGIEQFLDSMEKFIDKFAPEAHQFEIAQSDMTRAFEAMGLTLPETRDGFWELMQSIDATTESGQEQIATILRLTDSADAYYDFLEDADDERAKAAREAADAVADAARAERERAQELRTSMEGVDRELLRFANASLAAYFDLRDAQADQIRTLMDLGASENQLARARELHHRQMQAFTNDLQISILTLADDLFGVEDDFTAVGTAISNATSNIRDSVIRSLESIDQWLDRSLLGNFSPLTPTERLGEANSAFFDAIAALDGGNGDLSVLADLPQLADALLGEASGFFGTSTEQYRQLFDAVRAAMTEASQIDPPAEMKPPTFGQVETIKTETSAFRSRLDDLEKMQKAWDLGNEIATLATATGDLPADLVRGLGFTDRNMRDLLGLIGADAGTKTGEELEDYFNSIIGGITDPGGTNDLLAGVNRLISTLNRIFGDFVEKMPDQFIGPTQPPTEPPTATYAMGGWVPRTEPALVHSGEYVVPRGGALVNSDPEQTAISKRQDDRLRNIERILSNGFATVTDEERKTRMEMSRKTATARA